MAPLGITSSSAAQATMMRNRLNRNPFAPTAPTLRKGTLARLYTVVCVRVAVLRRFGRRGRHERSRPGTGNHPTSGDAAPFRDRDSHRTVDQSPLRAATDARRLRMTDDHTLAPQSPSPARAPRTSGARAAQPAPATGAAGAARAASGVRGRDGPARRRAPVTRRLACCSSRRRSSRCSAGGLRPRCSRRSCSSAGCLATSSTWATRSPRCSAAGVRTPAQRSVPPGYARPRTGCSLRPCSGPRSPAPRAYVTDVLAGDWRLPGELVELVLRARGLVAGFLRRCARGYRLVALHGARVLRLGRADGGFARFGQGGEGGPPRRARRVRRAGMARRDGPASAGGVPLRRRRLQRRRRRCLPGLLRLGGDGVRGAVPPGLLLRRSGRAVATPPSADRRPGRPADPGLHGPLPRSGPVGRRCPRRAAGR